MKRFALYSVPALALAAAFGLPPALSQPLPSGPPRPIIDGKTPTFIEVGAAPNLAPGLDLPPGSIAKFGPRYFWKVNSGATDWLEKPFSGFTTSGSFSFSGGVQGTGTSPTVVTLTNTGVAAGSYKAADITVGADGRITVAGNRTFGNGISTVSGTTGLTTTGIIAGTYFLPLLTADARGRITGISGISGGTTGACLLRGATATSAVWGSCSTGGSGDHKVLADNVDVTPDYLNAKIATLDSGNLTIADVDIGGGVKQLQFTPHGKIKLDSGDDAGYLVTDGKLLAGSGIGFSYDTMGSNHTLTINATGTSGVGWRNRVLNMAVTKTGMSADDLPYSAYEFERYGTYEWDAGSGTGSAAVSTSSAGGIIVINNFDTFTTASLLSNVTHRKFFIYARAYLQENDGAADFNLFGFAKESGTILAGVGTAGSNNNGGISNFQFMTYGQGMNMHLDSGVAWSSGYHQLYGWDDGSDICVQIDSSTPQCDADTGFNATSEFWRGYILANDGSFAENGVDRMLLVYERP